MKVKLKDIINEVNERTTQNNQYPILTSSQNGIFLQEEYFKKNVASKNNIGYKIIRKGEFTYRSMSDTGNFTINRLENIDIGIVSPAYPVFKCNGVNPDYLKYYFSSNNFKRQIDNLYQGGTRVALKLKDLENIEIEIPTEDKQTEIVKLLKNLDNLISRYEKAVKEKEQFIKSQFVEMFGNKECPKCKLNDITEKITKGTTPTTVGFSYENYGINFIKIESINDDGSLNFKMLSHINKSCYEKLSRSQLQEGDILFSIAGAIGKIAIVNKEILPANTNQALAIIRIKNNIINKLFLKYMLNSNFITQQYMSKKRGVAQLNLSLEDISNLEILNPAVEEQEKFASFVELIDKQKFFSQFVVKEEKMYA